MKKTKQFTAKKYSRLSMSWTVLIIDLCFLLAHVFYLIYFRISDITEMFVFNIVSVSIYAAMAPVAFKKPKYITLYSCITIVEVLAHAGAATLLLGWESGFTMFMVCCVPFPFFLEFKFDLTAYFFDGLIAAEFITTRLITNSSEWIKYTHISESEMNRLYLVNTCISFLMITVFCRVYKKAKRIDKLTMKARNETLTMLAKIDPLSQLFNRRAMADFLKKLEQDAHDGRGGYVIVMGDLDDFKRINDTYGHSAGDTVITTVSKIMTEEVPSEGYVCRWGGEELLFAVPGMDEAKGADIAERIRSRLAEHVFTSADGSGFSVTVTLGVCGCDGSISYEKAVSRADKSLYHGKENGKNTVVCASSLSADTEEN